MSSNHHTISVCIPTCNRPDLLQEAIRSATAQTRLPNEIVIGDDSTSDATTSLIERLSAASPVPLRYCRNLPRLGQNANINSLFLRAQGSHLVLLHDDDLLTPTALADLIRCWDAYPDLTGAFGKQHVISHAGVVDSAASQRLNQLYRRTGNEAGLLEESWRIGISQQWPNDGWMVLTTVAQRLLWRPQAEVGYGGEFDFGLRLGLEHPSRAFVFLNQYTSLYRLSEGPSISSSSNDDAALQSYRIVREMMPGTASVAMRECMADKLRRSAPHAMMQALRHAKKKEAWEIYRSASHPWRVRLSPGGLRRLLLLLKP